MVSYLVLGIIGILALSMKEYALAIAASTVGILLAMGQKLRYMRCGNMPFRLAFFFLMFFLLVPVTSGKVSSDHIMKVLTSPIGWGSIVAGFIVSCIGGKRGRRIADEPHYISRCFNRYPSGCSICKGITSRVTDCSWNHSHHFDEMKGSLQMKMTWKDIRVVGILFVFSCLAVPISKTF
jgi:uncharacterized membrane protein (DUF441 family)